MPHFALNAFLLTCALALNITIAVSGREKFARRVSVAVLDLGQTETGRRARDRVATGLVMENGSTSRDTAAIFSVIDYDQSRAAARGNGYSGSLNLTLAEARDLGAAIGCDFYIIGDARTLRRSASTAPVYYEAYASILIVSTRTGRLIAWDRPMFEAATPGEAESALFAALTRRVRLRYAALILDAQEKERAFALSINNGETTKIEDLTEADTVAEARSNFRPPQPYRRLQPPYPDTAAHAEVEATVDVTIEINTDGEVESANVVRWAGFGLDEAVINTVRQLHFRPAMREGVAVAVRVLLRYNFRRPPKSN